MPQNIIFILTLGLMAPVMAFAKAVNLQPVKMAVAENDRVQIRGFKGTVEIITSETVKDLTVEVRQDVPEKLTSEQQALADEWQFGLKREGSVLIVAVDGPTSKELWNQTLLSGFAPQFVLRITTPAVPVEVNWSEGKISALNHHSGLRVTQVKGDVSVIGCEGDLKISNSEGTITVRNHKGAVEIDSYLAKVDLENINGQIQLENFTGESKLAKIEGGLTLTSFRGTTRVAGIKGRIEYKNGNSPLHIDDLEGELRGKSLQGSVFAEINGEADVKVESQEGAVNLKLANSGAYVNLGTTDGSLQVPSFLKLTRLPNQQIRTGRLRGSQGGNIFVRTTSGDVRVR